MEDLIRAKDEQIAKLTKIKDALRDQVVKLKKNNHELEERIKSLEENKASETAIQYPDLEKKLKESEEKIKELVKKNEDLEFELKKLRVKGGSGKIKTEEGEELSIDKVLIQLKNGMFKLGQQNFTIDNKVSALQEKVDLILSKFSQGASFGTAGGKDTGNVSSASGSIGYNSKIYGSSASSPMKSESESSRASAEEYVSPGLAQANAQSESEEEKPKGDSFRARKPSDILRNRLKPTPKKEPEDKDSSTELKKPGNVLKKVKKDFGPPAGTASEYDMDDSSDLNKEQENNLEEEGDNRPTVPKLQHGLMTVAYPTDGVIKCPKCGAQNFQEMVNKAKVISFVPVKKYGKKYYCKKCRTEWEYDYV